MSGLLMGFAFYVPAPMPVKMTLLALCDHANDQGDRVYPSNALLMTKTGLKERALRYSLRALEEGNWISRVVAAGRGHLSEYRINVRALELAYKNGARRAPIPEKGASANIERGHEETGKGAPERQNGHPVLIEPSVEPSENRQSLSGKPDGLRTQAVDILNFLNRKTGRRYQPVPANLNLIMSRLREGATPDQCRAVIVVKRRQWADDPEREQYLRPETLFAAKKFASYVGQLPASAFSLEDQEA